MAVWMRVKRNQTGYLYYEGVSNTVLKAVTKAYSILYMSTE